ncbi:MAG: hypothetical protein LBI53_02615 [Candidatus Peribacteria bacterium]|nr:hypothetical protein [Candidatus Peribacteria bacterium]
MFKNFYVSFEGFDIVMDQNNKLIYEDITILIQGIEDRSIGNTDLKLLLDILRKNLLDRNQTSANVVAIQTHIQSSSIFIDQGQKELLDSILLRLSNADTINAVGGSEYERARNEILITLPEGMKPKVVQMFSQLELAAENLDEQGKKEKLSEILNYIKDNASEYDMDKSDIDGIILLNTCRILEYYNSSSAMCPKAGENTAPSIPNTPVKKTNTEGLPTRLKIILGIIFGGIAIVGLTIVFFAVKAKLREQQEVEDEEE